MSEDKGKKCSTCRTVKPLEHFDEGKALCQKCSEYKQRYIYIYIIYIEKTIEKNLDQRQRNIMNNTKDRNLRNRKNRLNVQFVSLTFQDVKC